MYLAVCQHICTVLLLINDYIVIVVYGTINSNSGHVIRKTSSNLINLQIQNIYIQCLMIITYCAFSKASSISSALLRVGIL